MGRDNFPYMCFNILISALCIISSYFYASMAGFRYTFEDSEKTRLLAIMLVFETFFLIHFIL
jgi:hypothetical protein